MSSPTSNNNSVYRFDGITVDGENFRVQRGALDIALTPRAFDVLMFFLENAGRVVEKQEIFDAVWKDVFVTDNALTKIIKEIRQALGDPADEPRYIETVPKRGYRFIAEIDRPPGTDTPRRGTLKEQVPVRQVAFIALGAILVSSLAFFAITRWRTQTASEGRPIDSIAVLPFTNDTQDAGLEYLSDGITENIINTLSNLGNLRVLPRTTVFYYKNKGEDPHTIGRALGVRAVLTGKVVQQGETLSIQTELIDIDRKSQIWGQQYNRPLADVITLQEEISRAIADRLSLRLNRQEQEQWSARSHSTDNPEAFRLYLKGRFYLNKRTEENIRKSIEYFNQAIELDPVYALAYTGIADAYITLSSGYSTAPTDDPLPMARTAALQALAIDERLAEAHVSLATIRERYEWNFAAAENEYRRAIDLDPDSATAHHRYGLFLRAMERFDEANVKLARACELDPLSAIIYADSGMPFYSLQQHEKAIGFFEKALEIEPDFKIAHFYLARSYALTGRDSEAIAEATKSFAPAEPLRPDGTKKINGQLALIYAMIGRKAEARTMLAEMEKQTDYVIPFNLARIYAALGDRERAFAWLEKTYRQRSSSLVQLKVTPHFGGLRDDPRYKDLVSRIGLAP